MGTLVYADSDVQGSGFNTQGGATSLFDALDDPTRVEHLRSDLTFGICVARVGLPVVSDPGSSVGWTLYGDFKRSGTQFADSDVLFRILRASTGATLVERTIDLDTSYRNSWQTFSSSLSEGEADDLRADLADLDFYLVKATSSEELFLYVADVHLDVPILHPVSTSLDVTSTSLARLGFASRLLSSLVGSSALDAYLEQFTTGVSIEATVTVREKLSFDLVRM